MSSHSENVLEQIEKFPDDKTLIQGALASGYTKEEILPYIQSGLLKQFQRHMNWAYDLDVQWKKEGWGEFVDSMNEEERERARDRIRKMKGALAQSVLDYHLILVQEGFDAYVSKLDNLFTFQEIFEMLRRKRASNLLEVWERAEKPLWYVIHRRYNGQDGI